MTATLRHDFELHWSADSIFHYRCGTQQCMLPQDTPAFE